MDELLKEVANHAFIDTRKFLNERTGVMRQIAHLQRINLRFIGMVLQSCHKSINCTLFEQ